MNRATSEVLSGRWRPLIFPLSKEKTLREEFERIALPHLSHHTAAFYLTKDEAEAEDLAQET